jgi:hypothetical protein
MVEKTKVSYDMNKKLKDKLTIVALNKGVKQIELLEDYIIEGLEKDKKFLTSHLD